MIVNIPSWGTAKVMVRRGKVAKSLTVVHEVPTLIEECARAEAPVVAGRPGSDAPIRIRQGVFVTPVRDRAGGLVSAEHLASARAVGADGVLRIAPEEKPATLDERIYREILDSGRDEAALRASRLADGFVLIDGILHGRASLPVWTVSVRCEAEPRIQLSQSDGLPAEDVRTVRFPLAEGEVARAAAFACHEGMPDAELLLPPRGRTIELVMPEVACQSAAALRDDDARREALALCRYPSFAALPPDEMEEWIALRALCESRETGVADRIVTGLRRLADGFTKGAARNVFAAGAIGGQIHDAVALFDCAWGSADGR